MCGPVVAAMACGAGSEAAERGVRADAAAHAQVAKEAGNEAFQREDWAAAVDAFSKAIEFDPTDAVFYSNRSGAYANLGRPDEALRDARRCVELRPEWWKAWSRLGYAQFQLKDYGASEEAYEKGLRLGDEKGRKTLQDGLEHARSAQQEMSLGDMKKLSTEEVRARLRAGYSKLTELELVAELGKTGIDAAGWSRERMVEALLAADRTAPAPGKRTGEGVGSTTTSSCARWRCCPSGRYRSELTPGDRRLEQRRRLLKRWQNWDEARFRRRLRALGQDASRCAAKEDCMELLLETELERIDAGNDPDRCHRYGIALAVCGTLGAFAATAAALLFFDL